MKQADANPSNDSKANPDSKDVATAKKPRSFAKSAIAFFTILSSCSLLTFSGDTKVRAQAATTPGIDPELDLPMSRRVIANLTAPSVAQAQFEAGLIRTVGHGNWVNEAPEVRTLAEGLGANELDKMQFAHRIHDYMVRNVDVEYRFGVGKGARGALIDLSGTSFDQAELMSRLLKIGGVADARVLVGNVTLTPEQFGAWSGLVQGLNHTSQTFTVNARAACHLMADGGIPGTVNGQTNCDQLSGNATEIKFTHAWVRALGRDWDTTIRKNKLYPDIDLPEAMGCGTFAANTCGDDAKAAALVDSTASTFGGAPTLSNLNVQGLRNFLKGRSVELMTALAIRDKSPSITQALGGVEIDAVAGHFANDTLIGGRVVWGIYSNGFPDQFRTKLTVYMRNTTSVLWADEIAGRRLAIYPDTVPAIVSTDLFSATKASIYLDKTLVTSLDLPAQTSTPAGVPPIPSDPITSITATLSVPHADPTQASLIAKPRRLPISQRIFEPSSTSNGNGAPLNYIVFQMGGRSERLSKHYSDTDFENMSCVRQCLGIGNESTIAAYLDQSGGALELLEKAARAEINPFFSFGIVSNSLEGVSYNLVGSYSVVAKDGNEERAAATARLAADLDSLLEGSSGQQLADTDRSISAVSMLSKSPSFVLVSSPNVAAVNQSFNDPNLTASVAAGNSVFMQLSPSSQGAQIQLGINGYASTIAWTRKGGGAPVKIDSVRPQDNLKQNRLTGSWGTATIASGELTLDSGAELTVGIGEEALTFSRYYSSSARVRETTESAQAIRFSNLGLSSSTLVDEAGYLGPDSALGFRIGGGWMHSFQESSTITNAASRYLRPKHSADGAVSLAYMAIMLDLNEQTDIGSIATATLASSWLSDQFLANAIVTQSSGASQAYVRQANGIFLDRSTSANNVEVTINRVVANTCFPIDDTKPRAMNYKGSILSIRFGDGTRAEYVLDTKSVIIDSNCEFAGHGTRENWGSSFLILSKRAGSGNSDRCYKWMDCLEAA